MITDSQIAICEELGWTVTCDDRSVSIESWSPAGEDLFFTIDDEDFVHGVWSIAADFDVDEHVEMWIPSRGNNGVPSSISALVEDAKEIQDMLYELLQKLREDKTLQEWKRTTQ